MYCGDETGSFVGEVGSHSSRFGYGGDDSPKYCVPSYVATTTTTTTTVATVKKLSVPTSCYNSKWATATSKGENKEQEQVVVEFQSALRMAQIVDSTGQQPVVDPTHYLQQGDCIHDFDAYEYLWQSAFDALKVRDRLKHTKGGGSRIDETIATTSGSDNTSPASTTIRSATAFWDTKCIHPLLAVSPGCTYHVQNHGNNSVISNAAYQRKEMAKLTEIFFETLHAPALFIAPAPMLAAFSQGRQTALVVDIGAAGCRVTPVVDGILLKQSQRRSGRGGDWLGNVQWQALLMQQNNNGTGVLLQPRYQQQGRRGFLNNMATATTSTATTFDSSSSKGGRGIFHRWAMQDLMYEFRSSHHVRVPEWRPTNTAPFMFAKDETAKNATTKTDEQNDGGRRGRGGAGDNNDDDKMEVDSPHPNVTTPTTTNATMATTTTPMSSSTTPNETTYELPDGTLIDLTTPVGRDLCRIPELLFSDELPFLSSRGIDESILNQHDTLSNLPLHQLIRDSLSAVGDVDVRKDLASSILLTGACSLIPQLEQRLSWQVSQIISTAFKPKVLASRQAVERSCASWIGGSILTSLGSFQQLWLGRSEYEEYGATLAIQRFP